MIDISTLPDEVVEYVVSLRKEAAKHRLERNAARDAVGSLRFTVGSQRADIEQLRAELEELKAASHVGRTA
jgi:phage shock protein A